MGYTSEGIGFQSSETSHEAAKHNVSGKLTLREQVRELFNSNDTLTTEDVSRLLNKPEISVQPRISELKFEGFLEDSGMRKQGKWGTNITLWQKSSD